MSQSSQKKELLQLDKKKLDLQQKITFLHTYLTSPGMPGLRGNLVDIQGYPRSDIDIPQIRKARNQLVCLQNDHVALMKQIEEKLFAYHASKMQSQEQEKGIVPSSSSSSSAKVYQKPKKTHAPAPILLQSTHIPFGWISQVLQGSPAQTAGLKIGDAIVEFGWANHTNHKELSNLVKIVSGAINSEVKIKVLHKGETQLRELVLVPKEWAGKGVLGCRILPNPI